MSKYRWITSAGHRSTELEELITRALAGELWEDIGSAFYQCQSARKKASNIFLRHATESEKTARRAALVRVNFNRQPAAPRNRYPDGGGRLERPMKREQTDPWAGMGMCFANRPLAAE